MLPASPLAAIRWLPLISQASSTIPAFGCLRVVRTALDASGQLIYAVDQPNGDVSATYLFNGPCAIAVGGGGSGTLDFPAQALWEVGTPAVGDSWGPVAGQWSLAKDLLPGFPVLGIVDSGTGRMMIGASFGPAATIVKPAYDIAAISGATPGSGTGEIYTFDGTNLSDAAESITVFNLSRQVAHADIFYECIYVDGYAFIVEAGSAITVFEAQIYGAALTTTTATAEVTPTLALVGALPTTSPLSVQNDFGLQGPVGRNCLVLQADSGTYYLIQIQPPSDVLFTAELGTTLLSTDSLATVTVTGGTAIYGSLPTETSIEAQNLFKTSGNSGDRCLVAGDIFGNYFLIPTTSPNHTLFWATLGGAIDETVASQSVTPTIGVFGALPASAVTALNTPLLTAQDGGLVLIAGTAGASPTYYIVRVPPTVMFWGVLVADLAATDTTVDVDPTGAVYGPLPSGSPSCNNTLKLSGKETDRCLCLQSEAGTYYLIGVYPASGGGIVFTLQSAGLSTGSADATVDTAWGGIPDGVGDTVTVNDLAGLFPNALGTSEAASGATGLADYDPTQGYVVAACDQQCLALYGTVSGAVTTTEATITVGSLSAGSPKPFGQLPSASTLTANNTFKLAAASGDAVKIEFNGTDWIWTQVMMHKQTVLTNEQLDGSLDLQTKTRDVVGMFNNNETSFATVTGWSTTLVTAATDVTFASDVLSYDAVTFSVLGTPVSAGNTVILTATTVDAVVDLQYAAGSTHAAQFQTQPLTVLDAGTVSGWTTWAAMAAQQAINDVTYTGGVLARTYETLYVFEAATNLTVTLFTTTTC
jgi:hypothetical protein